MINYTSNHWKKINNSIDHKEELKNFRRNKSKSLGMDDANKSSILNIAYYNFMKKKFCIEKRLKQLKNYQIIKSMNIKLKIYIIKK